MTVFRFVLALCACVLIVPTVSLALSAAPSDGVWWLAMMMVGGAWCALSLAWDWTDRHRRR